MKLRIALRCCWDNGLRNVRYSQHTRRTPQI